jgi:hypothetical protein
VSLNSITVHAADSGILATPSNNVNSATGQQLRQNRTVVVRFSYNAQQDDELDLKEGEKLEILEDVEDGWARGQVLDSNGVAIGKSGMFPTNFVDSLSAVAEGDANLYLAYVIFGRFQPRVVHKLSNQLAGSRLHNKERMESATIKGLTLLAQASFLPQSRTTNHSSNEMQNPRLSPAQMRRLLSSPRQAG